jgi:S1-C subfamily serine protease
MNEKNDIMILDAVERYIRGEMNPDERLHFENLRKTNSEIDQLVVEHTLFLQQVNRFGEWQKFKSALNEVHTDLTEQGKINSDKLRGKAKIVYLWKRYRRVAAIAASIAGIVAISISTLVNSLAPHPKDPKIQELVSEVKILKDGQKVLGDKIKNVEEKKQRPVIDMTVRYNGTGFLISSNGLMITNAHVVKNSKNIFVQNNRGDQFRAIVLRLDPTRDVAIIKIDDDNFRSLPALPALPYGIRKTSSDLAESIFTLGYPRNEIVYGEGYLSSRTGFEGDTLSFQISVAANPGNSGGPVFNKNGEVIGILSTKETHAEGAVFAIQSKYIYKVLNELKRNPLYENIKISSKSSIDKLDQKQQVSKILDYVFMVKGD